MSENKPLPAGGRITAMRFQKRNTDRVNLYLDGEYVLALPALEAARLKVGQHLEAADLERLQGLGAQQLWYDKAINFLAYRPRSEAEVGRFLREKGADEAAGAAIIAKLRQAGYVDDRAFARWWVENRQTFNPRGAYVLRSELRLKGIPLPIIEEILAEGQADAAESIRTIATARARRLASLDARTFKRRLSDFLLRRGFAYGDIAPVVEQLLQEREQGSEMSSETQIEGENT